MSVFSNGMTNDIVQAYNSFSGSDIRAMIGPFQFAQIQAISYNITREKAPIYTMGSPDPRSFSRNKRGIAGSLIWINFDRHALLDVFRRAQNKFIANRDDIRPAFATFERLSGMPDTAIFSATGSRGTSGLGLGATVNDINTQVITRVTSFKERAFAWHSDQVLPFDITLVGATEIGAATNMKLHGVEILNEATGMSVDDAVAEMQATFVARLVEPWMAVASEFQSTISAS